MLGLSALGAASRGLQITVLAVVGTVVLGIAGFAYWQYGRANALESENGTLRLTTKLQNESILRMEKYQREQQDKILALGVEQGRIQAQRDQVVQQLQVALSSRRAVADPKAVSREASEAIRRLMQSWSAPSVPASSPKP